MTQPFTDVYILPSYSKGFYYSWNIAGDFNDPGPWKFTVYEGLSDKGPWTVLKDGLENVFSWKEDYRPPVNKSNVLYFKVSVKTPKGTYDSPVVQPYGKLNRRDFLLAREIMRQAVLHSKGMAGVAGKVYLLSTFGPPCRHCLDPVTGMIRDSHCKHCFGTGRDPAYSGPYTMWLDFSEDSQHQVDTSEQGTIEKKSFQVRAIGNPVLKSGDVLVVPSSDKRYIVGTAAMTAEIRRIPIIQTLMVDEAPQTDKVYDI